MILSHQSLMKVNSEKAGEGQDFKYVLVCDLLLAHHVTWHVCIDCSWWHRAGQVETVVAHI